MPARGPIPKALTVTLAEEQGRLKTREIAREVLRAAYTETRHLLEQLHGSEGTCSHGPGPYQTRPNHTAPYGRLDGRLLELVVSASAGEAAARSVKRNFDSRMSIWTGSAKHGIGIVEFLRIVEEELLTDAPPLPSLEPERARLGLVLIYGIGIVYRHTMSILDEVEKDGGARPATTYQMFKDAVMRTVPVEHMHEVLANCTSVDDELKNAWDVISGPQNGMGAAQNPGFYAFLRGALAISDLAAMRVADSTSGDDSGSWFEDDVLRPAVARRSVPESNPWKTVTFEGEGNTGLRMLQVTLKTTGQDWLVVQSVRQESVAEAKRIKVGMLLYAVDNRCVVGLPKKALRTLWQTMEQRPLTLEFTHHFEHISGDWRYEQVLTEIDLEPDLEDDYDIPVGWVTSREGLHRRAGGNQTTSRHWDEPPPLIPVRTWRDDNPYLNGEIRKREKHIDAARRHAAELAAEAPPEHDPDKPVITGRAFGVVPADEPRRLKLVDIMWHSNMDSFLLVCILVNAFMLAVQAPENTLDKDLGFEANAWLNRFDNGLSIIFSIEMVCKCYCLGLVVGPTSYLRSRWNMIDFAVVLGIWFGWVLALSGRAGTDISFLRTMRALRPLRSMRYFKGVKRIMASLNESSGVLLGVTGLLLFCYTVFTCIGVLLFAGGISRTCDVRMHTSNELRNAHLDQLYLESAASECPMPHRPNTTGWDVSECPRTILCHEVDTCLVVPKYQNENNTYTGDPLDELTFWGFDNAGSSYTTLFIVTTLDEWPAMCDVLRDSDLNLNWTVWTYFAVVVLVTGTVVANLFIAVVTLAFARARESEGAGGFTGADLAKLAADQRIEEERLKELENEVMQQDQVKVVQLGDSGSDVQTIVVRKKHRQPYIPGFSPICGKIAESAIFETFIMAVVIGNTAVMMAEHHGMTEDFKKDLEFLELIACVIYTAEVIIKNFGLGTAPYFRSAFNILDFSLVVLALGTYALEYYGSKGMDGASVGRMLRMMRLFRAARMVKVLRKHESVMMLLETVLSSWSAIMNVVLFISILTCILAIMGLQLYGQAMPGYEPPRENFSSFGRAVLSVYQIFTGEDWSPIMFSYMHGHGAQACFYFFVTFIITNFALANLFVAVILENFAIAEHLKPGKQEEQYKKRLELDGVLSPRHAALEEGEDGGSQIRLKAIKISANRVFEDAILFAIIVSTVHLAVEGPPDAAYLQDGEILTDGSTECKLCWIIRAVLGSIDVVLFLVFWFEAIVKLLALGAYHKAKNGNGAYIGYFADNWNRLDFFIVIVTSIDFVGSRLGLGPEYAWISIFRTFRVLRPLRMVQHHENIRIVLEALLSSAGAVSATLVLAGFMVVVFGIIALNLFMGKLWFCSLDGDTAGDFLPLGREECAAANYSWVNRPNNFDDIGSTFESLFVVATLEGWVEIMNWCLDITDIDQAPSENASEGFAIYFIIYTLLGGFFITNLFVGVLVEEFQQSSGSALMTEEQEKWARFELMCHIANEQERTVDPAFVQQQMERMKSGTCLYSQLPLAIFRLAHSKLFETCITFAIVMNTVVMLAEHYPERPWWRYTLETFELSFMLLFTVEVFVNAISHGIHKYWSSHWHKLDVCIVIGSWWLVYLGIPAGIQALRSMRILKLILKYDQGISRSIVQTIVMSISPALNVTGATSLVIFIYSVAGMQLYGHVPQCDGNKINEGQNFSNIFRAMQFLYQIATGQDFITVVRELRDVHDAPLPFAFFGSFYVLAIFVFLNLFVAVLLEKFEREFGVVEDVDSDDEDDDDVHDIKMTKKDLIVFREIWERHTRRHARLEHKDSHMTCMQKIFRSQAATPDLACKHVRQFVMELPEKHPLGVCRELHKPDVWFNRLLTALKFAKADGKEVQIEEIRVALEMDKLCGGDLNKLPVGDPRRSYKQPRDDTDPYGRKLLIDRPCVFVDVAHALGVMAKRSMGGLTFAERMKAQQLQYQKREEMALRLIEIVARAWRARRNQPPKWQDAQQWFTERQFMDADGEIRTDLNRSSDGTIKEEDCDISVRIRTVHTMYLCASNALRC